MKQIHYHRTLNTVGTDPHVVWSLVLVIVLFLAVTGMYYSYEAGRLDTEFTLTQRMDVKLDVHCLRSKPTYEWVKEDERERTKELMPYAHVSEGLWCYNSDTNRVKWLTEVDKMMQKEYKRIVKDLTEQLRRRQQDGV